MENVSPISSQPPSEITIKRRSKKLELAFPDGKSLSLPFELLRVYSPSAETQGHSPEEAKLESGKRDVDILELQPVGNYAVKPVFSDGHDSGIYSWEYLARMGTAQDEMWHDYLNKLEAAGLSRDS